jgi:hypothetical protein
MKNYDARQVVAKGFARERNSSRFSTAGVRMWPRAADLRRCPTNPSKPLCRGTRARSNEIEPPLQRHARACRGHPRLSCRASASKAWMAGTSPAMTPNNWFDLTGTRSLVQRFRSSNHILRRSGAPWSGEPGTHNHRAWGYGFRVRHLAVAPRNDSVHMIGLMESLHWALAARPCRRLETPPCFDQTSGSILLEFQR